MSKQRTIRLIETAIRRLPSGCSSCRKRKEKLLAKLEELKKS